jgi:plasmid stability protein
MSGLLIKDVPPLLHRSLKRRAARHRRSLTKEALAILEAALQTDAAAVPLAQLDRRRVRGRRPLTDALIRRGKERGRA